VPGVDIWRPPAADQLPPEERIMSTEANLMRIKGEMNGRAMEPLLSYLVIASLPGSRELMTR